MNTEKKSEIVVITGASAGVGRATAHEFAKRKARIGLIARSKESLEETRREVMRLGGEALVLPLDVSKAEDVFAAAQTVSEKWGPIDIWVNNAMVSVFSPVKEMTAAEYQRVTEVTYLGYVYGTMAALKQMIPRNHGKIIQVSSALAYRSIPLQSAYCAAKHAIKGFTESLRVELLHDKSDISVTLVDLPAVNTPQFRWVRSRLPRKPQPVPPIYQPEVIANGIYFAAHSRRRSLRIGVSTDIALWAEKWVPSFADRHLASMGYESQQTNSPVKPNRLDNLFEPQFRMASTHGDFDKISRNSSFQLFLSKNRNYIAVATMLAATAWLYQKTKNQAFRELRGKNRLR
ncbi:MAG: SDR family oxidoreductase [Bdellovibrio sp.]